MLNDEHVAIGDVLSLLGNLTSWVGAALVVGGAIASPVVLLGLSATGLALGLTGLLLNEQERAKRRIVDPICNRDWQAATTYRPPRDPLAIDLNNNGIQTLGIGSAPVLFDHDADGVKTGTGWLAPSDAWLAMDRDGNGTIDSGRELFGVDTLITNADGSVRNATTGFDALNALDANHDGVFDAKDAAFTKVRLWQDLNSDGVSQSSELFTLAAKGIASISLAPTTGSVNLGNGNTISGTAKVTRTDGSASEVDAVSLASAAANLNLADNPFYRQFKDHVALTDKARQSPEMGGSGWTRDLREAMSIDSAAGWALHTVRGGLRRPFDAQRQQRNWMNRCEPWPQPAVRPITSQIRQ